MTLTYTKDDVIIWPDDPRVGDALNRLCYFADSPMDVLNLANSDCDAKILKNVRLGSSCPFISDGRQEFNTYGFIIIKNESRQFEPFNFAKKLDRNMLRGQEVKDRYTSGWNRSCTFKINTFYQTEDGIWLANGNTAQELFEKCVFVKTGKPVGKEFREF